MQTQIMLRILKPVTNITLQTEEIGGLSVHFSYSLSMSHILLEINGRTNISVSTKCSDDCSYGLFNICDFYLFWRS
jgi:hypothetical protein